MTPRLLPTLRRVVDARAGMASRLWEITAEPVAPDLFVTAVSGPPPSYHLDHAHAAWNNSSLGSGAGFSREQSIWATIGETMERYAGSIYDRSDFILAREDELPGPIVDQDAAIGFTEAQFRQEAFAFAPYDAAYRRHWVAGRTLPDNFAIHAPAQSLYLSQEWSGPDLLGQTVSTGLACHVDEERATLGGLLELIERDGFASAWLLHYAPPRLEVDDELAQRLSEPCRRALASKELKISLRLVANEFHVPTVIAFAESRRHGFGVVGASARLSIVDAVEKAVIEVLHGWSATAKARSGAEAIPDRDSILRPHDHSLFHLRPETWRSIAWFHSSEARVAGSTLLDKAPAGLGELVERVRAAGYNVSVFDLTTDDVAALGFKVMRVVVPGLQPLTFGQAVVPDDRRRLHRNAALWGMAMPPLLNDDPHPFP